MRQKFHSLTLVLIALFMMLLSFASCSKLQVPSITPQLEAKAPLSLLITESVNMGKGGIIYYNGGSSDYQALKSAAAKQGLTNMGEDNEDGYMSVTFYSAQKKALISLEYDPEVPGATDQTT